jgi:hypothetical protein
LYSLTSLFDTLTTFPLRGTYGRYMNGLIHGGTAVSLLALGAVTFL